MVHIRDRKWVKDISGKDGEVVDFFIDDASDIDSIETSRIADCSTAMVIPTGDFAIFANGAWTWT